MKFAATTAAGVAAAGLLFVVDPNQPGHYPVCPFLGATGYYCPGCGSLRATHDLLHLDPAAALQRNPLAVVVVPLLVLAWALWAVRLTGRRTPSTTEIPVRYLWTLLGLIMAFWGLRNVPGWTFLSPV